MPELPDVDHFRRVVAGGALHRRIDGCSSPEADVLDGVSARTLGHRLKGRELTTTRRHGKHLFLAVDEEGYLEWHFGMTGWPELGGDGDEPHRHACLVIRFADGGFLAYCSQRRIGHVSWCDDVEKFVAAEELGPDAADCSADVFRARIAEARGAVKSALMDQKRLAGIGNVYADEICFQAGIDPRRQAKNLSTAEVRDLERSWRRIAKTAASRASDPARLPRSWLLPHRDDPDGCPRCGAALAQIKASGRTSLVCPDCQG